MHNQKVKNKVSNIHRLKFRDYDFLGSRRNKDFLKGSMYLESALPILYISDFCTVFHSTLGFQRENFKDQMMGVKGIQKGGLQAPPQYNETCVRLSFKRRSHCGSVLRK